MLLKFKTMFVFLSILLSLTQPWKGNSQYSETYRPLKPNVLAVDVDLNTSTQTQIELRCGDAFEDQEVLWMNEGLETGLRGNQVHVTIEEMIGGNYTCHNEAGQFLNYTLVLAEVHRSQWRQRILEDVGKMPVENSRETTDDEEYIQCTSKNYSGSFHRTWKWSKTRKGSVVLITAVRSSSVSDIFCSLDSDKSGVTCWDQSHCPYVEEVDHITLTVYIRHWYFLEKYFRQFYITEIVKPDKLRIEKATENTFKWIYPRTWSFPSSYFPLTFQVKVVPHRKGCDYEENEREGQVNLTEEQVFSLKNTSKNICVRAQDTFTRSIWSDWSKSKMSKAKNRTREIIEETQK